jgi:hypothetical protein
MRAMGWSYRRIAWNMHVAKETVRTRLLEDAAVPMREPIPPIEPPRPVPQPSPLPVAPEPATPVAVAPVVSPPEPFGLESVPAGCKRFFLVNGKLNAEYAHHLEQHAVGINAWHKEYVQLAAFQNAEKIWVVLNRGEDNRAFILSIANDIWIRERCAISVGTWPGSTWVQAICKSRMLKVWSLKGREWWSSDTEQFEAVHGFQAYPLASHTDKLAALIAAAPEPEKTSAFGGPFGVDEWRWRWSGAR